MWVSEASEKEGVLVLSHLAAGNAGLAPGGGERRGCGRAGPWLRVLRSRTGLLPDLLQAHTGVEEGWGPAAGSLLLASLSCLSRVDLVVHSLKDLPTVLPPGFTIGAICK